MSRCVLGGWGCFGWGWGCTYDSQSDKISTEFKFWCLQIGCILSGHMTVTNTAFLCAFFFFCVLFLWSFWSPEWLSINPVQILTLSIQMGCIFSGHMTFTNTAFFYFFFTFNGQWQKYQPSTNEGHILCVQLKWLCTSTLSAVFVVINILYISVYIYKWVT